MGRTNLKDGLERKFASLAGELVDKRARIDHIEGLFQELPVLSRRAERVKHLLHCAEELLKEIDPTWKPEKVKPTRPHAYKEVVPKGDLTKSALAILRETGTPYTCRQLAIAVLDRHGITEYSKGTLQQVTNAVNATLRAKDGVLFSANDDWPAKWTISVKR